MKRKYYVIVSGDGKYATYFGRKWCYSKKLENAEIFARNRALQYLLEGEKLIEVDVKIKLKGRK